MSLQTLKRRVGKLEAIRAQKSEHVVVVFHGTPEANELAKAQIEEGRLVATKLGKDLRILRVGWFESDP
jgi:hypothetical protein